jgi:hypothetical protein
MASWGWYGVLEKAADYKLIEHDRVLEMEAYRVFTHLCFIKNKEDNERQQLLRNIRKA